MKAAIVGFGYMGRYHLNKIRQISGARVAAVWDVAEEKREQARLEGLNVCGSLEELLSIGDMDLVVVSTPNQFHAGLSVAALEAGKHVLCEKPGVLCEQELREVLAASEKAGKVFSVHHNRRWDVDYLAVKEVVQGGRIGGIVTLESRVLGERGVVYGWRGDPASGGGMLYDWGPHLIDQALNIFAGQKVTAVCARLLSVLTPAVDDFAQVDLYFDSGVCARIEIGTMALQKLPRWYIYGDRGTMKLDDFSGNTGGIARIRGDVRGFESVLGQESLGPSRTMAPLEAENLETIALPKTEGDPLAYHRNLFRAMQGEEESLITPEDLLRETRIIDAAFRSSKEGEVVHVSI